MVIYHTDKIDKNGVKQRGGGIMVYIKDNIYGFSNTIPLLCNISVHLEQFWFEICKPYFKRQIICVVYRPPSGCLRTFIEELSANIDKLEESTGF